MRKCGECQLCCKLLPVADFKLVKDAGKKCKHQKYHVGCKVYNTSQMPASCSTWNCRWLVNDDTHDLPRPDRAGYVIDMMPDFVGVRDNNTGAQFDMQVLQVWIDTDRLDAVEAESFRTYLDRQKMPALVRLNERISFVIFPPSTNSSREWAQTPIKEADPGTIPHSVKEIATKLGGTYTNKPGAPGEMNESSITTPDGKTYRVASFNKIVYE